MNSAPQIQKPTSTSTGTSVLQRMARYQLDLARRGITADEPIAFILTNTEALQLLAEGLDYLPIGIQAEARKWLRDAEGWQLSGRLRFLGRHVCVLR